MAVKKGPLETKLEPRRLGLLADEAAQLETIRRWQAEDHEKMLLLCDHMRIEDGPDRFYRLALELARKHCAGFQERRSTRKWTDLASGYLVVEVKRLTADRRKNPMHTASWATGILAKRAEWAEFLGGRGHDRGEALRVRYQAFMRDKWSSIMWRAFKLHEHEGTITEWDRDVHEALCNGAEN